MKGPPHPRCHAVGTEKGPGCVPAVWASGCHGDEQAPAQKLHAALYRVSVGVTWRMCGKCCVHLHGCSCWHWPAGLDDLLEPNQEHQAFSMIDGAAHAFKHQRHSTTLPWSPYALAASQRRRAGSSLSSDGLLLRFRAAGSPAARQAVPLKQSAHMDGPCCAPIVNLAL